MARILDAGLYGWILPVVHGGLLVICFKEVGEVHKALCPDVFLWRI